MSGPIFEDDVYKAAGEQLGDVQTRDLKGPKGAIASTGKQMCHEVALLPVNTLYQRNDTNEDCGRYTVSVILSRR